MEQTCINSVPLNALGEAPASSSEFFQFSEVTCITVASTTPEYFIAQQFAMYAGIFFFFVTFIFIVWFLKNR